MRDRRRANACLVGESRTTHAPDECRKQTTGDRRPRLKGLGNDAPQGRDDFRRVDHQYDQATHDISHTHDRHHLVGHFGNALDAADDHEGGHQCHDRSKDPLLIGKEGLLTASDVHQLRGDLVHLENIATAKGGQHTHHCEKSREHQTGRFHSSLGETFPQVIHRTTMHTTRGIKLAVFHSQCAFRKFRRHANETAQEKPERDTGSAILNPDRNTRDVAKPHRARYRGTQRLKVSHLARIGWRAVFAPHRPQCQREGPQVYKAKRERDDHTCRRQPEDHGKGLKSTDVDLEEDQVDKRLGDFSKPRVDFLVEALGYHLGGSRPASHRKPCEQNC